MGYSIRETVAMCHLGQDVTVEALARVVPQAALAAALEATSTHEDRDRALSYTTVLWVVIAMHLFTTVALGHVLRKVVQGRRFLWPDPEARIPTASALCYRRYQMGARPVVALFHQTCRPIATPATPGAFQFGLRLMVVDGTTELVPDTPANAAAFGRPTNQSGECAYPQVRIVYLLEAGTHALVDAGVWPYRVSEWVGAYRVLRSVAAGMLVLVDRGLHSYDFVAAVRRRDAHVLGRLPANVGVAVVRRLVDGSVLAWLRPANADRRPDAAPILVRIITYTLTDPALPGHGEEHRLLTTLLDPAVAPAIAVVCAYHERWEVELTIDEHDTHQRLPTQPLRSKKPVGVIQELYGLFLAHYAVRVLMHEAALTAGVAPDRLSFVHAVRVIQDAIPEFQLVAPADLPRLAARLLHDIAQGRLPARRHRSNPRVVKRPQSKFPRKRPKHTNWPQPTMPFREAILLI
jgi:Insertion element 4 transposase N-terminal/Transposase DDE domain